MGSSFFKLNKVTIKQIPIKTLFWSLFNCLIVSFLIIGCGDIIGDVVSFSISPPSAVVGINGSENFSVTAKDSNGMIVQVTPLWDVFGPIGNISPSGLFIAGSTSGEGYVVARYESKSANARVTVTDTGWLYGTVQSSLTSGYVPNIKVYLAEIPSLYSLSGSDGRYEIANIPAGTYRALTEQTENFQSASKEVTILKGEREYWPVNLEAQSGVTPVPTTLPIEF